MKCGRKSGVVAHEGGRKRGVLLYVEFNCKVANKPIHLIFITILKLSQLIFPNFRVLFTLETTNHWFLGQF